MKDLGGKRGYKDYQTLKSSVSAIDEQLYSGQKKFVDDIVADMKDAVRWTSSGLTFRIS